MAQQRISPEKYQMALLDDGKPILEQPQEEIIVEEKVLGYTMVGDSCVGKSSLIHRFVNDSFYPGLDLTSGYQLDARSVCLGKEKIRISVKSTAGNALYTCVTRSFCRGAVGVLLVYDVTKRSTFDGLQHWIDHALPPAPAPAPGNNPTHPDLRVYPVVTLVGNTTDLEEKRVVSSDEGRALAKRLGFLFAETSAKSGAGVDAAFLGNAAEVLRRAEAGGMEFKIRRRRRLEDGSLVPIEPPSLYSKILEFFSKLLGLCN